MPGRPQPAATGVRRKAYGRRDGSALGGDSALDGGSTLGGGSAVDGSALGGGSVGSACDGEASAAAGRGPAASVASAASAGDGGSRLVELLPAACRLTSAAARGLAGRFDDRRVASGASGAA